MKKWIFALLFFLIFVSVGTDAAFAAYSSSHVNTGVTFTGEYTVEYFDSDYSSIAPEGGYVYTFTTYGYIDKDSANFIYFNYDSFIEYIGGTENIKLVELRDNKKLESQGTDTTDGIVYCKFVNYYVSDTLLTESSSYNYSCDLYFNVDGGSEYNITVYYELSGELPEGSNTTPEVTPDVEEPEPEEPTPEVTPVPTPKNTPTPTPTPGAVLELNAFADNKTAVAQYYTGGCEPVKSIIEFYEVDAVTDILTKVNSENFVSGAGTMRNTMTPGKVYRYKLTYVFQRDGIQYEKFLWSDDLTCVDQELEDFRKNGKITNFRTLMIYTWENILSLELPIEGFHISFQTLFIWLMIAVVLIWFFKKYIR